jgi:hypothetical protein
MIEISDHVIKRYRQRCSGSNKESRCKKKLYEMWERGSPAEVKKEYRAFQLAKHGVDKVVEYRLFNEFVLVSVDNILTTIHRNESNRWQPASWLETEKAKKRVFQKAMKLSKCCIEGHTLLEKSIIEEFYSAVRDYEEALENGSK